MNEPDVVVAGTGAAGMMAAITAAHHGLRVLLVEKDAHFGGSTARSGGGVWIPGNTRLRAAGADTDAEAARTYLRHIVDGASAPELQDAYLRHGPAALDLLLSQTPMRMNWVRGYSDYYPEAPGGRPEGRSIEPAPFDGRLLGEDRALLNPPYMSAGLGIAITQADYRWLNLVARHPRGLLTALRVGARSWFAKVRGREPLTLGQALAAGMWLAVRRAGIDVWLDSPITGLEVDDAGVRVRVAHGGAEVTLRPGRGVVLAAGGFERNQAMREEFGPTPINAEWSVGATANTGDAIALGRALGAEVALMDDAWWAPSLPLPRGPVFLLAERSLPGSLLVNAAGDRFTNEAAPYVDAVHAMYAAHTEETPAVPAWLIFDQRYRDRYLFAGKGPRQGFSSKWYRSGALHKADTLEKLGAGIGVPGDALAATVARFNTFADAGVDADYHRGESAYDRYYGDPRNRPNPCLAALVKPPFYAARIVPGDLGTKGGLVTDERARVLRADGTAIPGLYAAGNTSALVMGRTYAGPGATLGPAITFGYLAALDLAGVTP
ncbi:3-oxosteroid 1-dehydrogenase [Spongisporangium articulatum]|uniref:3-oxosteroid 1-dehydrogenase n=1 Tax=Spongisporangium articulatum TaxID=3362603 RepID=A0ABW8ATP3_9ACTN